MADKISGGSANTERGFLEIEDEYREILEQSRSPDLVSDGTSSSGEKNLCWSRVLNKTWFDIHGGRCYFLKDDIDEMLLEIDLHDNEARNDSGPIFAPSQLEKIKHYDDL